ncbi:hypothetical protein [Inquilinus limosus]|uniref:hypothetical protein n=1 Tax=Inquilinus limosus TaxID=171674 RepID=UPI00126A5A24|nr:hypothetical protein [Inquilinus limosus]
MPAPTLPTNDRDDELRYAMNQLEAWLARWGAGQAPNGLQLAAIKRAVGELHIDEGETHADAEPSAHEEIADLLAAADPEHAPLVEGGGDPAAVDYTLPEFERDMELLRPKYEYLSWLGGRPVGHA